MQDFQYNYGDQPLAGYTIQRAAGRGGFGEVYYAVSDSGRQVALKVIQNYEQIELRGISQCMNLKSPHLVTIFDVKHNTEEKPFVVMEFVSGPSLRNLLDESPSGLGKQKAAFFLREIGKGLSFLHECGIVHRDLKPGNIFYENGYVKIGDYGLSKAISGGVRSGQTITVGTVHYMAPEIGAGSYDRSIDIYALGVLLYEMLTGAVPYLGSSPGEVLMKHISAEPDLTGIEEPFARVIRKALAKDPKDRYQSVQQMVEDVFGSEHIRNSVSHFSPESLSMVARQVAQKAKIENDDIPKRQSAETAAADSWQKLGNRLDRAARRMSDTYSKIAGKTKEKTDYRQRLRRAAQADPITRRQRRILALITMVIVSLGTGIFNTQYSSNFLYLALIAFAMIKVAANGIFLVRWRWFAKLEKESRSLNNFAAAVLAAGLAALILAVLSKLFWPVWPSGRRFTPNFITGTCIALGIGFGLMNWWKLTSPTRRERVSLGRAVGIGALGFIAAMVFRGDPALAAGVLAGTLLVVQISCPFVPQANRAAYLAGTPASAEQAGKAPAAPSYKPAGRIKDSSESPTPGRVLPQYIHLLWLLGFVMTLGVGLMLLIWSGISNAREGDFALAVSLGIGSLIFSLFCLVQIFRKTFTGWYRYLIKPLLLLILMMMVLTASICLGCVRLPTEETLIALFFIIFPGILFLFVLFIPSRVVDGLAGRAVAVSPTIRATAMVSPYKRVWALILAAGIFLGAGGLHRFYVGKVATGILWLMTGGLFGIGQVIDVIMILFGRFRDCYGFPLVIWESADELKTKAKQQRTGVDAWQSIEYENKDVPVPEGPAELGGKASAMANSNGDASSCVAARPQVFEPFDLFSLVLAGAGNIFLFLAFLVGLAVAVHLPAILAGINELSQEMYEFFGTHNWPGLIENIAITVGFILLLIGATFIILARRRSGAAHIIRAGLGIAGLLLSMALLSEALPRSYSPGFFNSLERQQFGLALEELFGRTNSEEAIISAIFFLVSIVILAWPPRRRVSGYIAAGSGEGA